MNNKITLNSYDTANILNALDMYKALVETIGSSVFRTNEDFLKRNYQLNSVSKLCDFLKMVCTENRSQQGDIQTEIILVTNEVIK